MDRDDKRGRKRIRRNYVELFQVFSTIYKDMNLVNLRQKLSLVSQWGMKNMCYKICMYPEALWGKEVDCNGSGWEYGN